MVDLGQKGKFILAFFYAIKSSYFELNIHVYYGIRNHEKRAAVLQRPFFLKCYKTICFQRNVFLLRSS